MLADGVGDSCDELEGVAEGSGGGVVEVVVGGGDGGSQAFEDREGEGAGDVGGVVSEHGPGR